MSNRWSIAPKTLEEWESGKAEVRSALWRLLGDLPPLFTPQLEVLEIRRREGYSVRKIAFDNGAGATVYGYLLAPEPGDAPMPAILYHHAHGNKYDIGKEEIFQDRVAGIAPGVALAQNGYVALAIDAYAFGERQTQGPGGGRETGAATELSLFKKFLWEGGTLWGMMLRDDLLALNALLALPEVDAARVGATGMSLGGSRSTWTAGLDERIRAVVPVAQMTRYQDYARQGDFSLHGIYYYVPGMLRSGLDMEMLVSLAAPRRQRILIGDGDPLSPIAGVEAVIAFARQVYQLYGASDQFEASIYQGIGHQYTPEMFAAMLDTFRQAV